MKDNHLKKKSKRNYTIILVAVMCVIAVIGAYVINYNSPSKQIERLLLQGDRFLTDMNYEEAVAAYKGAIEIDPKNKDIIDKLENAYVEWATSFFRSKEYDEAVSRIDEGIIVLGSTEELIRLKIQILWEQAETYIENGELDKAEEIARLIEEIDSKKGQELLDKINDKRESLQPKESSVMLIDFAYLANLVKPIFCLPVPSAEWERSDVQYITYADAENRYKYLIEKLESYIDFLDENSYAVLLQDKSEKAMSDSRLNLVETETVDGIEYLTMSSAYNLLVKLYLITDEMEKAFETRKKFASFIGDENILNDHDTSFTHEDVFANKDVEIINKYDKYGRLLEYTGSGYHRISVYGESGACPVHQESEQISDGTKTKTIQDYTYEDGRLVLEAYKNNDYSMTIEYTYSENRIHGDLKSNYGSSEWDYRIDKYGRLRE